MQIVHYIILATLAALALYVIVQSGRIASASRRQMLLSPDITGNCQSLGFVGCSVVCFGEQNAEHIESLLSVEYDLYEVIIVLDAQNDPDTFRSIVERYGMIKVNAEASSELPAARIRNLYRSRQRCFRRLIVIDRESLTPYDDLDAGTAVASYDYIIPIGAFTYLMPNAVETAMIAISSDDRPTAVLHSLPDDGRIFHRETVISNGGFSPHIMRYVSRHAVRRIYSPLTYRICNIHRTRVAAWTTILAILIPLLIAEIFFAGTALALATLATAALIIVSVRYAATASSPYNCSVKAILCHFSRISNFFHHKRFTIS